jgi:hypothetical protein
VVYNLWSIKFYYLMEKEYLPFEGVLAYPTWLAVKFSHRATGKPVWVDYIVFPQRKDGTFRHYTEIYNYFVGKEGFRFAIGYVLEEGENYYSAQTQYFYFDKKELPYYSAKRIEQPKIRPK